MEVDVVYLEPFPRMEADKYIDAVQYPSIWKGAVFWRFLVVERMDTRRLACSAAVVSHLFFLFMTAFRCL